MSHPEDKLDELLAKVPPERRDRLRAIVEKFVQLSKDDQAFMLDLMDDPEALDRMARALGLTERRH